MTVDKLFLPFPGRFLPYGYVIPDTFQECLTWQVAMQWIYNNLETTMEKVDAMDPTGDFGPIKAQIRELQDQVLEISNTLVTEGATVEALQTAVNALTSAQFQNQIDQINNDIASIPRITVDTRLSDMSNNPVANSVIYSALAQKADLSALTDYVTNTALSSALISYATKAEVNEKADRSTIEANYYNRTQVDTLLANKQNTLTIDQNPEQTHVASVVSSAGVYNALATKQNTLIFDNTPTAGSANPVTSNGIYTALDGKADKTDIPEVLTPIRDVDPTSRSPVESAGIYVALNNKQDRLQFDNAPQLNSANPVTSSGIYAALAQKANITDIPPSTTIDNDLSFTSRNAVQNRVITAALNDKADRSEIPEAITVDGVLSDVSENPVENRVITEALAQKANISDVPSETVVDDSISSTSPNPVENRVIAAALADKADRSEIPPGVTVDPTISPTSPNPVANSAIAAALATKQDALTFDTTPTPESTNPVTSAGVKSYVDGGISDASGLLWEQINLINQGKQDNLTFDSTPTQNSTNPVYSGGVWTSLQQCATQTQLAQKQDALTFDTTPLLNSTNPVTSNGIASALAGKQDMLTVDQNPTTDSPNPVASGGVAFALTQKQNLLTFDSTPTAGSTNPVTSDGIYSAITSGPSGPSASAFGARSNVSGNSTIYITGAKNTLLGNRQGAIAVFTRSSSGNWLGVQAFVVGNVILRQFSIPCSPADSDTGRITLSSDTSGVKLTNNGSSLIDVYAYVVNDGTLSEVYGPLDDSVTSGSQNGVRSSGIYTYGQDMYTAAVSTTSSLVDGLRHHVPDIVVDTTVSTPIPSSTAPISAGWAYGVETSISQALEPKTYVDIYDDPSPSSPSSLTFLGEYSAEMQLNEVIKFPESPILIHVTVECVTDITPKHESTDFYTEIFWDKTKHGYFIRPNNYVDWESTTYFTITREADPTVISSGFYKLGKFSIDKSPQQTAPASMKFIITVEIVEKAFR